MCLFYAEKEEIIIVMEILMKVCKFLYKNGKLILLPFVYIC